MTLSVLHISSMCQKNKEIAESITILLKVKVDYSDYSIRGSYTAPTFKEQYFLKVGVVYDPRKL